MGKNVTKNVVMGKNLSRRFFCPWNYSAAALNLEGIEKREGLPCHA